MTTKTADLRRHAACKRRKTSGRGGERPGLASRTLAVVIVIVVLVAAVGIYYVAVGNSRSSQGTMILASSTNQSGSSSITTGRMGVFSSSTTSSHVSQRTSSSLARSSSAGSSGTSTYSGTFNFSLPLGPTGERVLSNGTVQRYTTVQVGSGSFTFSIDPQNYIGTGSGHGTLKATTTGFCSGEVTLSYTFLIPDATNVLGGNVTVFIGTPTPGNFTVPLTCTGPMQGVNTATNNPESFLSVYPNEISAAVIPVTVTQHLQGNITYYYSISRTS